MSKSIATISPARAAKLKAKAVSLTTPADKVRELRAARSAENAKLIQRPESATPGFKVETIGAVNVELSASNGHDVVAQQPAAPPAQPATAEPLAPAQRLSVPLKYIHAALSVTPKSDVRYYLNGVHLHQLPSGQTRLVATDGHRLLVVTLDNVEPIEWLKAGVILPQEQLTRVARFFGKEGELSVDFGVGHPHAELSSAADIGTFKVAGVDGKFPDYQRVVDAGAEVFTSERNAMETTNLNCDYVKSAGIVAAQLGAKGIMPFIGGNADAAVVFTFSNVPEALLYVMPQKTVGDCLPAPAVRMYSRSTIDETIARLRAAEKVSRTNAKTTKSEHFRKLATAKADRLLERISQLKAAVTPQLAAPVTPATPDAAVDSVQA